MLESTRGKFIVLEGIDGCGKTTLLAGLRDAAGDGLLSQAEVAFTSEPTNRNVLARDVAPPDRLFGFLQDRLAHQAAIRHCLEAGQHVICDRYTLSTVAYQATALGLAPMHRQAVQMLTEVVDDFLKPDLTIFIDTPPEECRRRLEIRAVPDDGEGTSSDDFMALPSLHDLTTLRRRYQDAIKRAVTIKGQYVYPLAIGDLPELAAVRLLANIVRDFLKG